jgi:hypothetical protein
MANTPDTTDSQNSYSSRLKMPTFSGSSSERVTQWIKTFDRWCTLSNYKDDQKASLLPFVLVGTAAKIYEAWDISGSMPTAWTDVKAKLEAQFQDKSRVKIYEATLLRRKLLSSESFDDYYADIISLCSSVKFDMPNSDKIHHLLKGLPENLVQFILFKEPQTPEDVLKAYTTHKTAKLLTTPTDSENQTVVPAAAAVTNDSVASALISKFENLLQIQNEKITELQILVAKQNDERKCFRCQKTDHLAKDCSLPRTPQPAPRRRDNSRGRDPQVYPPSHPPSSYYSHRPRTPSPGRYRNDYYPSDRYPRQPDRRDSDYRRSENTPVENKHSENPPSDYRYANYPQTSYRSRTPERYFSRSPSRHNSSSSPHRSYQSSPHYRSSSPYRHSEN